MNESYFFQQELHNTIAMVNRDIQLLLDELSLQANLWYLQGLSPEYRLDASLVAPTQHNIPIRTVVFSLN